MNRADPFFPVAPTSRTEAVPGQVETDAIVRAQLSAGVPNPVLHPPDYLKVKLAVVVSPARTVIFCSWVPNVAVQACSVYSPDGRPLIVNAPSSPVTAKNGLLETPA